MDLEVKDLAMKAQVVKFAAENMSVKMTLKHLRGRASVAVLSRERMINAKLEGWPEVKQKSFTKYNMAIFFLFSDHFGN